MNNLKIHEIAKNVGQRCMYNTGSINMNMRNWDQMPYDIRSQTYAYSHALSSDALAY